MTSQGRLIGDSWVGLRGIDLGEGSDLLGAAGGFRGEADTIRPTLRCSGHRRACHRLARPA